LIGPASVVVEGISWQNFQSEILNVLKANYRTHFKLFREIFSKLRRKSEKKINHSAAVLLPRKTGFQTEPEMGVFTFYLNLLALTEFNIKTAQYFQLQCWEILINRTLHTYILNKQQKQYESISLLLEMPKLESNIHSGVT
jgi:hypothetical protein